MDMNSNKVVSDLIKESIISDHAFGFEPEIEVNTKWDVVAEFKKHGFHHLSLSVATDMTSLENTVHYLVNIKKMIERYSDQYILINNAEDIVMAKNKGKLALSFMFQGTNPLAKNIDMVDVFYELGVRSLLLSYNIQNAIGSGCTEVNDTGLSRFGQELVSRMNDRGMLIDCSHVGIKTSLDAMRLSNAPVIFSHSNVHKIHPHTRNVTDEQIMACATTGGFIGINGNGPLLGELGASIEKYVDHIDYIVNLVGDDYVALGTDHVYFKDIFDEFMQKNALVYPGNYDVASVHTWHSIGPNQLPDIVEGLLRRGYQQERIKKILGGNFMRVARMVFKK